MQKHLIRLVVLIPVALGSVGLAHATPVTYDFTASNFVSYGSDVPNSSLSGSFTLDGDIVTGINLTIGSHTYLASEVGVGVSTDGAAIIGGTSGSVTGLRLGTDDFLIRGSFGSSPEFFGMLYSVAGVSDFTNYFETETGSISVETSVPEPGTLALFAAGLLGLGFSSRFARNQKGPGILGQFSRLA